MPEGSTVLLTYDGTNITNHVLWASARFESQLNAVPGTFQFTARDLDQSLSFVTGKKVELSIDGTKVFGGYVMQIGRTYPFPAMDTNPVESVPRYWIVRGVDYNILFDRLVIHNDAEPLKALPNFSKTSMDGSLIEWMCANWIDLPSGFDSTTYVQNIRAPFHDADETSEEGGWVQHGSKWRDQMVEFANFSGALWYIDANMRLHYQPIESTEHRWGFSDQPNNGTIAASPEEFQGTTIGPRDVDFTEDITTMVNDMFMWSGAEWAGEDGETFFARETNELAVAQYGRWQRAEFHFGEQGYQTQTFLEEAAERIVEGVPDDTTRGHRYPQYNVTFTWFGHDVPLLSGARDHLVPGKLVSVELEVFSLQMTLPLRSMLLTFPNLDPEGNGYVQFQGTFGTQPDDPFTMWRYLLRTRFKGQLISSRIVDDNDTASAYGATGHFVATNVSGLIYKVKFGYIATSTQVYVDGLRKTRGIHYTESNPKLGQITFLSSVSGTIQVTCKTLAS